MTYIWNRETLWSLLQHRDAHVNAEEQDELHPHAGERVRVAVVADGGRCGDRLLAFAEELLFGHGQMNPGVDDAIELVDGSGELALKRALVVEMLGKIGGAEAGLIEELKPDTAAAR